MIDTAAIKARFEVLAPFLGERERRLWAASEALAAGRGGILAVSTMSGIARSTIGRGLAELRHGKNQIPGRIRRPGGGRKPKTETNPGLLDALSELVQSAIRGDPEAALLWVSRSQRHLAGALAKRGFSAGQKLVGRLLKRLGFSLQANSKTREGASHPDRDAQFDFINAQVQAFHKAGQLAISVDTKKKELVGDFNNAGRELRPKGQPEPVRVHDFYCLNWARSRRVGSTTLLPMPVGSTSGSPATQQPLPWKASGAGGMNSANRATPQARGC